MSSELGLDDVTVLVPLHRSARFVDVVEGNVRRLAPRCRLIVSDADGTDATFDTLRRRVGSLPNVEWVGPRPLAPGWIPHYNDLLDRVRTDCFMWLPHDDEIEVDYLERCIGALCDGVIGAGGVIESIPGPGLTDVPQGRLDAIDRTRPFHSEANRRLFDWNPGVSFRAVFRTAAVHPIASTNAISEWADIVWVFGVCLDGEVVEVPDAVYRKRWYDTSTHAQWRQDPFPHALPFLLREVRRRSLTDDDAIEAELIDHTTNRTGGRVDALEAELESSQHDRAVKADTIEAMRSETDALRAARNELEAAVTRRDAEIADVRATLDEVYRSTSWRIGQVLVGPVRVARWLRSGRWPRLAKPGPRGWRRRAGGAAGPPRRRSR